MTQAGYDKLIAEINELESVHRPEISRQIAEARDKGDLSENAEYDAAKEAQGLLEGKIAQLKAQVANARIIDESKISTDSVQILSKVTIRNTKTGAELTYTLVSDTEANLKEKGVLSDATAEAITLTVVRKVRPEGQKRKIEVEEALPIPMDEVLQTKRVLKF